MKKRSAVVTTLALLGTAAAAAQGCSSGDVPIARENTQLYGGEIDAGSGLCGAATCAKGELCCAGTDEFCSPTCMNVSTCPFYGRPCKTLDGGVRDGGTIDAAPILAWYRTCGWPDCPVPEDAGTPPPTQICATEGTPCTAKGQTCGDGGVGTCGSIMVCDDHDPKAFGCPISSAKFKDGIHYLNDAELASLRDETLEMRLATYAYKAPWANGSDATHLGFIIEDQPQSLSVDRGHDRVDLYGYVSMVVATMQVQEKEIRALRRELAHTRATCEKR
jgi:hypothetical protein